MTKQFLPKSRWLVTIILLTTLCINQMWGAEATAYTLSATNTGSDNNSTGYANEKSTTISEKTWVVIGNSNQVPWRIGGGKNTTGSSTNRYIYSQTAITENITKVVVAHGSKSNITVNSVTLNVYSTAQKAAAGGTADVSSVSVTYVDNGNMTFNRPSGHNWAGRFYRIDYTLTWSSSNSAKYILFSSATFKYESASCTENPSIGAASLNGSFLGTYLFARFSGHCTQNINHLRFCRKPTKCNFSAHLSITDFQQVTNPSIQASPQISQFVPFSLCFLLFIYIISMITL